MKNINLKSTITKNLRLKQKKLNLKYYEHKLEQQLNKLYNARSYKLWKKYCHLRDDVLRPDLTLSKLKQKIPWELKSNIKKFLAHFDWNKKEFETYKKILLKNKNLDEDIKIIKEKVSIIIPTKNAGSLFKLVLKKIRFQKYISQLEIIILDSGSTDDTLEIAKQFGAKIIKIKPEKFSHSATRNIGAKYATGDYIVFTVQDAFFLNERTLYDLINLLISTDSVAGSTIQIPRFDADLFTSWQINVFTKYISPDKQNILVDIDKNKFEKLTSDKKRPYCTIDDVCSIFLKKKFIQLDGYNEELKYGEDLEMGKRIIETGNKIIFLCNNGVVHSHTRPASYFLKRFYIDTVFLNTIFKNKIIINQNLNYDVSTLLRFLLKLGKALENKYLIKKNYSSKKQVTFTSLELISAILNMIEKKGKNNNDIHKIEILKNELDIFIRYQLNSINEFTDIKNLPPDELITLIDKIFSIFVGNKLAFHYLVNNKKFPEVTIINKFLESEV